MVRSCVHRNGSMEAKHDVEHHNRPQVDSLNIQLSRIYLLWRSGLKMNCFLWPSMVSDISTNLREIVTNEMVHAPLRLKAGGSKVWKQHKPFWGPCASPTHARLRPCSTAIQHTPKSGLRPSRLFA